MKKLIFCALFGIFPLVGFSDGHPALNGGVGTGITIDNQVMEGKSGVLVKNTTQDVWMWDNPPEGFPKATSATCSQFLAFKTGQEQPVGASFTCLSVDPDGDVSISVGAPQPSGRFLITQVAGTGKWEAYNGNQFIGGNDIQVDASTSVYSWKPVN